MTKFEVVLIATPGFGNLVPIVEFAQRIVDHDHRFSATILIINMPGRPLLDLYIQSRVATSTSNIRFVHLPTADFPSSDHSKIFIAHVTSLIEKHKHHVKEAITKLMAPELDSDDSESNSVPRLAGLFVDMFCSSIIDVAKELDIPCYLYFASPASFLSFILHLPVLDTQTQLTTEFAESDTKLVIPGFVDPVPPSMFPPVAFTEDGYSCYMYHALRYTQTKGIVINTLQELESHALNSFSTSQMPRVYPIGPVLDLVGSAQWHPDRAHHESIIRWLEEQPSSSVVFLCFGSMGCLDEPQVREIANGLERAGFRFLWSLREPPKVLLDQPDEYTNIKEVLPNGFLDRTSEIGLVCGWISQVSILAHKAIGGFVSHCGWNSILESLWHGVPIATWPIYAEQQLNALKMVKELGLAVEISLDYRRGSNKLVLAEEIERGIKCLMDGDGEVRKKVKEMSKNVRMAVMENGSSYMSLGTLIEELANNV